MQSGFATIGPRPRRLRSDEPHTSTARVVMHFPLGREKNRDVMVGEKIGRTMGAVHHAQFAHPGEGGNHCARQWRIRGR